MMLMLLPHTSSNDDVDVVEFEVAESVLEVFEGRLRNVVVSVDTCGGGGGGSKTKEIYETIKSPKSTLLADNKQGLKITKGRG